MKSWSMSRLGMALLIIAPLPAAAELNMVEGHWETIVQVQMKGGNFPIPAIKSSRCLTRDDPIPNAQSNMRCQIKDRVVAGNDVSWRVECRDDQASMAGTGKVTYAGETFSGAMDMLVSKAGGDESMQIKYTLRGNRVRACAAAPARPK